MADQDVAAAIGHAKAHALAGMGRHVGLIAPSSTAIVCRSALHQGKRGRKGGRSRESMDGGTSTPVFTVSCHENARHAPGVPPLRSASSAPSAPQRFSARLASLCAASNLPAWDVSFWRSAFLVATMLPLLVLQRRGALIDIRNAGCALLASAVLLAGSFVELHPRAWPGTGRQRSADVRRTHRSSPRCWHASSWASRCMVTRSSRWLAPCWALPSASRARCKRARSPAWRWPASSCCA